MTWIDEPSKEYKHKTKHAILCDNMSFFTIHNKASNSATDIRNY